MLYYISEYIQKIKPNSIPVYKDLRKEVIKYIRQSKTFHSSMLKNEDLISNVMTSIWVSDASYKEGAGQSIETRRRQYTEWEISKFRRSRKRKMIIQKKPNAFKTPLDYFIKMELLDFINGPLLTKEQRSVINAIYYEGLNQTETAAKIGCTQQNVSELHKEAIIRIKEKFSGSRK